MEIKKHNIVNKTNSPEMHQQGQGNHQSFSITYHYHFDAQKNTPKRKPNAFEQQQIVERYGSVKQISYMIENW